MLLWTKISQIHYFDIPLNPSTPGNSMMLVLRLTTITLRRIQHGLFCSSLRCLTQRIGQSDTKRPSNPHLSYAPVRRSFGLSAADVVNFAPGKVRPYLRLMRLDKPIGLYFYYALYNDASKNGCICIYRVRSSFVLILLIKLFF